MTAPRLRDETPESLARAMGGKVDQAVLIRELRERAEAFGSRLQDFGIELSRIAEFAKESERRISRALDDVRS